MASTFVPELLDEAFDSMTHLIILTSGLDLPIEPLAYPLSDYHAHDSESFIHEIIRSGKKIR